MRCSCELVDNRNNNRCRRRIETFHLIVLFTLITLSSSSGAMQSGDLLPGEQSCESAESCRGCDSCSVPTARPYIRSSLARSVYSKMLVDDDFQNFDQTKWYAVRTDRMADADRESFVQLGPDDEETQLFLERCQERSDAVFTQLFHLAARTFLAPFVSQTSINGLLRRGSMFVLSAKQLRRLLRLPDDWRAERMLDLGAGDGATTALLAAMFDRVHVTEMSWPMKRVLRARGFTLEDVDSWNATYPDGYDVICALNLLDRCSRPLSLLEQVKRSLRPGGFAVLALVWPFSPYVEFSSSGDHRPDEALPIDGTSFEEQAASFMGNVLRPMGFRVIGWARAPYLCEGDLERTFYHLNDIIVALSVPESQ